MRKWTLCMEFEVHCGQLDSSDRRPSPSAISGCPVDQGLTILKSKTQVIGTNFDSSNYLTHIVWEKWVVWLSRNCLRDSAGHCQGSILWTSNSKDWKLQTTRFLVSPIPSLKRPAAAELSEVRTPKTDHDYKLQCCGLNSVKPSRKFFHTCKFLRPMVMAFWMNSKLFVWSASLGSKNLEQTPFLLTQEI